MANASELRRICGQLVVGGFEGTTLPGGFARALGAGERGGAVLFGRNLTQEPMQCAQLTQAIAASASLELTPLIAVDQEGGRVARLKVPPVLALPPMATFGRAAGDGVSAESRQQAIALAFDAAQALGGQLAALGFTMNFAPVLDVNTRAENPIIGDRAFGDDPHLVALLGDAWARGLRAGGVLACGKHFPGHGDTTKDSHLDLPVVTRAHPGDLDGDLYPFRRVGPTIAAFMTAHVLYPSLDPDSPATLSRRAIAIARECLGPTGCVISDDLEMKAVADRWPIEEIAVRAIDAGCDALLVCRSEQLQERAVEGLAARASADGAFRARVEDAQARFLAMRRQVVPRPVRTIAEFAAASLPAGRMAARLFHAFGAGEGRAQ